MIRRAEKSLVVQFDDDVSSLAYVGGDVFVPTTRKFGNVWAMLQDVQMQFLPGYDGRIASLRTTATAEGVVFKKN